MKIGLSIFVYFFLIFFTSSDVYSLSKKKLSNNVNSSVSDLIPILTHDLQRLYFCRSENILNYGRDDIWYSDLDENGEWKKALNIGQPLNNNLNNFVCGVSPSGDTLILGTIYEQNKDSLQGISYTYLENGEWSHPKTIKIKNYYNLNDVNGFYLCFENNVLFMTIQRKDSYGGIDIYVSFPEGNWVYSQPINLGPTINTELDELSPFLAFDGITLYFSSYGHPGQGEADIFMSRRLDNTWKKWTKPENLGPEINSAGWDAHFKLTRNGKYAYFASNEEANLMSNIFFIELEKSSQPILSKSVVFRVSDAKKFIPLKNVAINLYENGNKSYELTTDNSGRVNVDLPFTTFNLKVDYENYQQWDSHLEISYTGLKLADTIKITLNPKSDSLIQIPNILFSFAEMYVANTFADIIANLSDFLELNPNFKIELKGHTDNVGSEQANYQLGLARAKAVAELLNRFGINNKRIDIKSYGKNQPLVPNDNEENMSLNRRVEIYLVDN
ncbi:MAG: OmpA family protein [Desulfobulbaceae bacterium]|nr:OmpA family protein [Desulfobulbaceae bacterium]